MDPQGPMAMTFSVRCLSEGTSLAKKAPSYREAAAEIEEILAKIDAETDVDIDELAGQVERAAELIRLCSDKLRSAESRVEKVTRELAENAGSDETSDAE